MYQLAFFTVCGDNGSIIDIEAKLKDDKAFVTVWDKTKEISKKQAIEYTTNFLFHTYTQITKIVTKYISWPLTETIYRKNFKISSTLLPTARKHCVTLITNDNEAVLKLYKSDDTITIKLYVDSTTKDDIQTFIKNSLEISLSMQEFNEYTTIKIASNIMDEDTIPKIMTKILEYPQCVPVTYEHLR